MGQSHRNAQKRRGDNAQENSPLYLTNYQQTGHQHADGKELFLRLGNNTGQRDNGSPRIGHTRTLETQRSQKETHTHRRGTTQREGNALHNQVAQPGEGKNREYNAFQQDGRESKMPGIAHLHAHCSTDKKGQSHAGSHGQRTLGIDRHQEGAHRTDQSGGREQGCSGKGVGRSAHALKSLGGQGEDISHHNKGAYPGKQLGAQRVLATVESEYLGYFFHVVGVWGSSLSVGKEASSSEASSCRELEGA